jgi:hypothetical protein
MKLLPVILTFLFTINLSLLHADTISSTGFCPLNLKISEIGLSKDIRVHELAYESVIVECALSIRNHADKLKLKVTQLTFFKEIPMNEFCTEQARKVEECRAF